MPSLNRPVRIETKIIINTNITGPGIIIIPEQRQIIIITDIYSNIITSPDIRSIHRLNRLKKRRMQINKIIQMRIIHIPCLIIRPHIKALLTLYGPHQRHGAIARVYCTPITLRIIIIQIMKLPILTNIITHINNSLHIRTINRIKILNNIKRSHPIKNNIITVRIKRRHISGLILPLHINSLNPVTKSTSDSRYIERVIISGPWNPITVI